MNLLIAKATLQSRQPKQPLDLMAYEIVGMLLVAFILVLVL